MENMRRNPAALWRLLLACVLLSATLGLGWGMDPARAVSFVREYGYFFTMAACGLFIIYAGIWLSRLEKAWFRPKVVCVGFATVLGASFVVFHGSELDYKILMDDYLLAATAKSLHESGEVSVADFGREIDGEFRVVQSFVDKRPWFYPFLVSLLHAAAGYDTMHPFAVNAVLAVILLGIAFAIGYALGGYGGAVLSVLLWASLPLLQQNATGGGMEMLNLVMIHVVLWLSICYLRTPCAAGEGTLCLAGVLLTYSRYESGLFLGAILIVVALGWWQRRRVFLSLPALSAAPLLLAALVQTQIYAATESSWELSAEAAAPFSLGYFWGNLSHAFAFFWSLDPAIANSLWLGLWAVPAVLGFAYVCCRRSGGEWWARPANRVWAVFFGFLLLNLVVVLCFHAAQFDKRYVARYSLPAHALIVFSTVACLAALRARTWAWSVSVALTALFIAGVTWPKNGQALYTKANFMIAEQHWLEAMDAQHVSADTLVIDRFNTAWTLRERTAMPPHLASLHADRLKAELAAGKYGQLLLVERLTGNADGLASQLPASAALRGAFEAELLGERSFREGHLTRVYRLRP